jgi:O-antigen/teichoic acid export membrane protein
MFGFRGLIGETLVSDPRSVSLLLILIVLAPIGAFTTLLEKLVAVFARPRDIFFRRHVLGPALKLLAVVMVISTAGDVFVLAYGYLVAGSIGVWLYLWILIREWKAKKLLDFFRPARIAWPLRELFGFSLPLYATQISVIIRGALVIILLEYLQSASAVAEYRAVYSLAGLNLVVYEAFYLLFVPVASRMFARNEMLGVSDLYWKTAIWITVLTFPVFAVTCALAEPLTVLLFGDRYAGAGTLLAILAFGHFFHAALGFNAAALRVHGRLRFLVISDVIAAVTALLLCLTLIPRYGAAGAAVATSGTLILHNIVNQIGLKLEGTGIHVLDNRFVRVYVLAVLLVAVLVFLQWWTSPPLYVSAGMAIVLSLLFIRSTRQRLNPEATFPELLRVPLIRRLLL